MRRFVPVALAVIIGLGVTATVGRPHLASPTPDAKAADQCQRATSERTGNWVCFDTRADRRASSSSSCDVKGCWAVASDFVSTAYMRGSFGYGKKPLGTVYLSARHTLNGAAMYSRDVRFNATVKLKDLHASGSLLVGSHKGKGEMVNNSFDLVSRKSLAKGSVWKPWGSRYYSSKDTKHLNHANVIEVAWSYGDYPGYWYAFQKSAIADDPNDNEKYGFNTASYRFVDSAHGGYHHE